MDEFSAPSGVDAVQFDYVRFPDGFEGVVTFDGDSDQASRFSTITSFLAEATSAVDESCPLDADIFGFINQYQGRRRDRHGDPLLAPGLRRLRAGRGQAQVDATDSLGLGWMLWNSGSVFTEAGILRTDEHSTAVEPLEPYIQVRPRSGLWDVAHMSGFALEIAWLALEIARLTAEEITPGMQPSVGQRFLPDSDPDPSRDRGIPGSGVGSARRSGGPVRR